MARKSKEEQQVVGMIAPRGAPEPPSWLEAPAAAVWRETVADLPSEHLRAADLQLLPGLCRLLVHERQLWKLAQAQWRKIELADKHPEDGPQRKQLQFVYVDLHKEIRETQRSIALLASKLRLCASANTRIETGSNKRKLERKKHRPWLAS